MAVAGSTDDVLLAVTDGVRVALGTGLALRLGDGNVLAVSDGVALRVGLLVGAEVGLSVATGDPVGDGVGDGTSGVAERTPVGVALIDATVVGVGLVVAVGRNGETVGVGLTTGVGLGGVAKRIRSSATTSAAVMLPSPLTSAPGQLLSSKTAATTAARSASFTPSMQSASPGTETAEAARTARTTHGSATEKKRRKNQDVSMRNPGGLYMRLLRVNCNPQNMPITPL